MDKTKKTVMGIVLIIALITLGYGGYKYYNFNQYKKAINNAETAMDNLEYDKAISLFNESLKYKKDDSVSNKIKLSKELKVDKQSYDKGINLMKIKKYNEAINSFKLVSKKSKKLYSMAHDKIKESTNMLINEKIKVAKENVKNKKYEEANNRLDEILKIDNSNKDAKNLKKVIAVRMKEIEDLEGKHEEQIRREEEENKNDDFTREMAIELLKKMVNRENDPDVVAGTCDIKYKDGKKYIFVMLKSKKLLEAGGTGTIECGYIAKDGSRCIYTDF